MLEARCPQCDRPVAGGCCSFCHLPPDGGGGSPASVQRAGDRRFQDDAFAGELVCVAPSCPECGKELSYRSHEASSRAELRGRCPQCRLCFRLRLKRLQDNQLSAGDGKEPERGEPVDFHGLLPDEPTSGDLSAARAKGFFEKVRRLTQTGGHGPSRRPKV
jgi:hypothetical protein